MDYNWKTILKTVDKAVQPHIGSGRVADYIPALAAVNPRHFGMAVALADGSIQCLGDADMPFSVQSISKVFTLSMVLRQIGADLWQRVGREPSGSSFNSIIQLEHECGIPRNPLINAGAIVTTDHLVRDGDCDSMIDALLARLRHLAQDDSVYINSEVAASEAKAGARNLALGNFMASYGNMTNPVEQTLSAYFRHCAIAMSCQQLARAALFLAFDGRDPVTGEQVITSANCRRINAVMMTCGHYDNSGDFAYRIGLPGKSGVGGGILVIAPKFGAIAVWSPGLNGAGTSSVGSIALESLVEQTGWNVFV